MKWCFSVFVLLMSILFFTSLSSAGTTFTADTLSDEIDGYVQQNEETNAGVIISLFESDDVIFQGNYGYKDIENGLEVDDNTVFEWGSITKLLVWVSVMQLWENGQIDLAGDVRDHLPPDVLSDTTYDHSITMTHLMNHEAGFQENLADLFVAEVDEDQTLHQAVRESEPVQIYEPGNVSAYSNHGVALAALVVEEISGQAFDTYVKENIFEPLEMEQTSISVDASDNEWVDSGRDEVKAYSATGSELGENRLYIPLYPAGSAIGTMTDLIKFGQALLPGDSGSLLFDDVETLNQMHQPTKYFADTDIPYNTHGFWVEIFEEPVIGHGGNTSGFSSHLRLDINDGVGYAVMANQENEVIYNHLLAGELFGKAADSEYSGFLKDYDETVVRMARTVKEGPQKFMNMLITPLSIYEPGQYVMVPYEYNGRTYYSYPNFDLETLGIFELISVVGLYLLFFISIIYSALTLTAGGLIARPIRNKRYGGKTEQRFNRWHYIGNSLALLIFINFIVYLMQITGFADLESYVWQLHFSFILLILLTGYIISYCVILWKSKIKKWSYIKYMVTLIAMLTALAMILYLDLYQFWAI